MAARPVLVKASSSGLASIKHILCSIRTLHLSVCIMVFSMSTVQVATRVCWAGFLLVNEIAQVRECFCQIDLVQALDRVRWSLRQEPAKASRYIRHADL